MKFKPGDIVTYRPDWFPERNEQDFPGSVGWITGRKDISLKGKKLKIILLNRYSHYKAIFLDNIPGIESDWEYSFIPCQLQYCGHERIAYNAKNKPAI